MGGGGRTQLDFSIDDLRSKSFISVILGCAWTPKYPEHLSSFCQWERIQHVSKLPWIFADVLRQHGHPMISIDILAYSHRKSPFEELPEDVLEDVFGLLSPMPYIGGCGPSTGSSKCCDMSIGMGMCRSYVLFKFHFY